MSNAFALFVRNLVRGWLSSVAWYAPNKATESLAIAPQFETTGRTDRDEASLPETIPIQNRDSITWKTAVVNGEITMCSQQ